MKVIAQAKYLLIAGLIFSVVGCGSSTTMSVNDLPCGKYKNGQTIFKGKNGKCYYKDGNGTAIIVDCGC